MTPHEALSLVNQRKEDMDMKDWLDKAQKHLEKCQQFIDEGCSECKDCMGSDCEGYKIKNFLDKAYKLFPKPTTQRRQVV